jgi:hypothetical protein
LKDQDILINVLRIFLQNSCQRHLVVQIQIFTFNEKGNLLIQHSAFLASFHSTSQNCFCINYWHYRCYKLFKLDKLGQVKKTKQIKTFNSLQITFSNVGMEISYQNSICYLHFCPFLIEKIENCHPIFVMPFEQVLQWVDAIFDSWIS